MSTTNISPNDNSTAPNRFFILPASLGPATTLAASFNLYLPTYAFVGPAKVYVNAYTTDSINNGVPFCPEVSQPLIILAR
jgi:hypothetical protein